MLPVYVLDPRHARLLLALQPSGHRLHPAHHPQEIAADDLFHLRVGVPAAKQLGAELPGDAAEQLGKKLGGAIEHMGSADDRMKGKDPSGARESARSAADALQKARDSARQAARQAQQENGQLSDEPVRIPGADEYKAPERFREDLLEAAKQKATDGFEEMTKRYYEELSK